LCDGFTDGTTRVHYGRSKAQFCDSRDGRKYVYVTIGEQVWMAENLNYNAPGSKCGNGSTLSDVNTVLYSVRCVKGPSGCTAADNTDTHYCANRNETMKEYGSVTDKGGKTYKTVVIGEQTWMAENLDYEVEYSKCYNNDSGNCEKYGRLYDWLAAMEVCPNGWHLPSDAEWSKLINFIDTTTLAFNMAGGKLKATSANGVDNYGFSALMGGCLYNGSFADVSATGYWWSATQSSVSNAYARYMYRSSGGGTVMSGNNAKTNSFSVRCVKD